MWSQRDDNSFGVFYALLILLVYIKNCFYINTALTLMFCTKHIQVVKYNVSFLC